MKKCLTCKATYEGHGGLRCQLDGSTVEYKTSCCVMKKFTEEKQLFERVGYIISITPA